METGENTFPPTYVGNKIEVRKFSDGILLVSLDKSDGVMKLSLDGSILWRTNTSTENYNVYGVQLNGENIVLDIASTPSHFLVLNNETGEVVVDAVEK